MLISMLEIFCPCCHEMPTYVISFDYCHAQGTQGAIPDTDNTLVPHDTPADGQAVGLFKRLRATGMKTCLLSNNKKPRVKPFVNLVGSCCIHKAGKPEVRGYKKVMELIGTDRNHTPSVRDQLFTDVYGTNRTGIYSTLIRPMGPRKEIQVVLKHYLGKPILYFHKKHARDINQDREQSEIVDGKTRICGLIANSAEHSMSPMMHNLFAQRTGVNLTYILSKAEEGRVEDAVKGIYALNILGANITVPHKRRVTEFSSELNKDAGVIGAVSIPVRTAAGYKGYNTGDVDLKRTLAQAGTWIEKEHCSLIGVRGAARAIACVLVEGGAADVHILSRNETKARELTGCINTLTGSGSAGAPSLKGYKKFSARKGGYLAVQSTSADIYLHVEDAVIDDSRFHETTHIGVGIVYAPARTRLMKMVQEARERVANGLDVLLYQGVIAYRLRNLQVRVDSGAIKAARQVIEGYLIRKQAGKGRGENLILIGFMRAGKTSMGEHSAVRYRMPTIDTDEGIEAAAGMVVFDIFITREEEAFRRLETGVLEKLLKQGGRSVVSVDGGLFLRTENGVSLKQLGTMVYLDVLLETVMERTGVDVLDRPMLHGSDVMGHIISPLELRKPYYLKASHIVVDVNGRDVDSIVREVHRRAVDKTY